jgi:hypothetical protein
LTLAAIEKTVIIDHLRENGGYVPGGYVLVLVAGYGGFDFGLPYGVIGDRAGPMRKVGRRLWGQGEKIRG